MKHTIEIDDELLAEVRKETGNKTDKGAVVKALREYVEGQQRVRRLTGLKKSVRMK
ncbi:MAG: type II toxin-antitoxin system VapB family antitoxin [Pontiellaceae bacterium]|nr:type II toxin-antitoxin system VapB family antitoxin [Pontiellaceae bacterium]